MSDSEYTATDGQAGLVYHTVSAHDEPRMYVVQLLYGIDGNLVLDLFLNAWQLVAQRHEALRTGFVLDNGSELRQRVRPSVEVEVNRLDLRDYSEPLQAEALDRFLASDHSNAFDLSNPPLLRLCIAERSLGRYWLVVTVHHSILDRWSVNVILDEVFQLYDAALRDESLELPKPRRYRDFVEWLKSHDLAQAERFWRGELKDFSEPMRLRVGRYDEPIPISANPKEFGRRFAVLDPEATERLRELATACRATLSTVANGAWALLLSRYTGRNDVLFGVTVAGRTPDLRGIESMVGLFVNTLPVRIRVHPKFSVGAWLSDLRKQQLAVRRFEHASLAQVQKWSEVARGVPLFDTLVVFQRDGIESNLGRGVRLEYLDSFEHTNYPFVLSLEPGQELRICLEYSTQLLDDTAAGDLLQHYVTCLEALTHSPDQLLANVPIVPERERKRINSEWNDTGARSPSRDTLVHTLIERQVDRAPTAPAVACEGELLTYEQLNSRANRLARYLTSRGVVPETAVGLFFERSIDSVIGILAIFKTGAACLPLDTNYPSKRLELILQDADPTLVLTRSDLRSTLPTDAAEVVCVDTISESLAQTPSENLALNISPKNLAYIIYTSGSMGAPKGCLIQHDNLANRVVGWTAETDGRGAEGWVVASMAAVGFDVFVGDIVSALGNGSLIVLVPSAAIQSVELLQRLLDEWSVNTVEIVPGSLVRDLAEYSLQYGATLPELRVLASGTEQWTRKEFGKCVRSVAPEAVPVNIFGVTEATIDSLLKRLDESEWLNQPEGSGHDILPIGSPLPRVRAYILDDLLNVIPVGVTGELFIGGAGVGRGYAGNPSLTAERFIPDLFGAPGSRLYRTGDLARYRPDGALEFVGRVDNQVKIRGFRVEPGEIEVVLRETNLVSDAVVVAREARPGAPELVAYITTDNSQAPPTSARLRQALTARLPSHMIPSRFTLVDSFPLTAHGKVDRSALPETSAVDTNASACSVPARTHLEKEMARIWREVLRVECVGIHDDFFELGGDSILSLQVVSKIRSAGFQLDVRSLFDAPTVAELAGMVKRGKGGSSSFQGLVEGSVPLTPIQQWFFEQDVTNRSHWNWAAILVLRQRYDSFVLREAVERLLRHHDALRLRYRYSDQAWSQSNAGMDDKAVLVFVDISSHPGFDRDSVVTERMQRAQRSLDIADGPLIRVVYFDLGEGIAPWLGIVVHHLVVDGISWQILLEDLSNLCQRLSDGLSAELPAKTTSFKEWAESLKRYGESDNARRELDYWLTLKDRCGQIGSSISVEGQFSSHVYSERTVSKRLSSEETNLLLKGTLAAYRCQIDEILLCALAFTVGNSAGLQYLPVEVEGHGRQPIFEGLDVTRTVGWFTSIHPVLLPLVPDSILGTLRLVKQALRELPNQGIGYGILRYSTIVDEAEQLRQAGQPSILFNYLSRTDLSASGIYSHELSTDLLGEDRDPSSLRSHPLEINVSVRDGELGLDWSYSKKLFEHSIVEGLADTYVRHLQYLVRRARDGNVETAYTPSDFPLVKLTQEQISHVLRNIGH